MSRKSRITLAIVLMASAIVFNLIILARGDESPGWPIAAIVLLGAASISLLAAASISLLAERRPPG